MGLSIDPCEEMINTYPEKDTLPLKGVSLTSGYLIEYDDRFQSMFLELLWSPWKAVSLSWPC